MAFRRSYRPRRGMSSRYTKKRGRTPRYSGRSKWTVKRPYRGIVLQNATELKRGTFHIDTSGGGAEVTLMDSLRHGSTSWRTPLLLKKVTNHLKFLSTGTADDQRIGRSVVVQAVRVYIEVNRIFPKAQDIRGDVHRPITFSVYLDKAPNGVAPGDFEDVFDDVQLASKRLSTADRFVTYDTKRVYPVVDTVGFKSDETGNHRCVASYIYTAELNFKKPGIVSSFNSSTANAAEENDLTGFTTNCLCVGFSGHGITFQADTASSFVDNIVRVEYDFTDN